MRQTLTRDQRDTIICAILCLVLCIAVLQLWLLTATMNAHMGGDETVIWPAAIASLIGLLLNGALLRYVYRVDRKERP